MPSFGGSQGEMVIGGILPIDTLTNYHPGMQLLAERIPKWILGKKYGITLPQLFTHENLLSSYACKKQYKIPNESEAHNHNLTVVRKKHNLFVSISVIRGFMTVQGIVSRACRIFLWSRIMSMRNSFTTRGQFQLAPLLCSRIVRLGYKCATTISGQIKSKTAELHLTELEMIACAFS